MSSSSNIYVAIVDDDESLCRSMSRLLRAEGMCPVAYLSAEDFLDDTKRSRFDCLVLDIRLGGMSGIELSQQLASSRSTTPVVFITASDDPQQREKAMRTPGASYLRKTDSAEVVLAAIRKAIHQQEDTTKGGSI